MKPLLKIVNTQKDKSFQIMLEDAPYFFPSWHFHPDYEIMLVLEGTGMRFVGDSMQRFRAGDLVFYGANIPHLYRSDPGYYHKDSTLRSKAVVVYFKEDFLGKDFWAIPDMAPIRRLLHLSKKGVKFKGAVKEKLKHHIQRLDNHKDSVDKIIDLLTILKIMANTSEHEYLSSDSFAMYVDEDDCERMNNVYQFIMDHYAKNPTLEEVASVANMSVTAFCRYFKSRTNKTYTQFLNEIKIGNACKLLIDDDLSISQVCFETGFNNFPHFNNQFKKIVGLTPSQYQAMHVKSLLQPKIG